VIARGLRIGASGIDLLSLTGWQLLLGAVVLAPFAATGFDDTDWTTRRLWLGVAFLTVAILSMWAWFKALSGLSAARVGSFTFLVPVVAVLIELARANVPSPLELAGIALVIVGIYVGTRVPHHAVEPALTPAVATARVQATEEAI
jgi:probable blue pigment (indigoidine) exporter